LFPNSFVGQHVNHIDLLINKPQRFLNLNFTSDRNITASDLSRAILSLVRVV